MRCALQTEGMAAGQGWEILMKDVIWVRTGSVVEQCGTTAGGEGGEECWQSIGGGRGLWRQE